jgi:hypothetical protein
VLTDSYLAAIGRIARRESAAAVAIGTGQPRGFVARTNPDTARIVQRFNGELSAAAEQHKIPWVDQDAVSWHGEEFETRFVDLFHKGLDWHRAIADAVLAGFDRAPATEASRTRGDATDTTPRRSERQYR